MAKKAVKKAAPKKSAYRGEVAKAAQALAQIETEIKEGLKVNDTSVLKLRKRIRANLNEIVQMLDRKRKNMSTQSVHLLLAGELLEAAMPLIYYRVANARLIRPSDRAKLRADFARQARGAFDYAWDEFEFDKLVTRPTGKR